MLSHSHRKFVCPDQLKLSITQRYWYICFQVIPVTPETKKIPERTGAYAQNELVFHVTGIPPLGLQTYWIQRGLGNWEVHDIVLLYLIEPKRVMWDIAITLCPLSVVIGSFLHFDNFLLNCCANYNLLL